MVFATYHRMRVKRGHLRLEQVINPSYFILSDPIMKTIISHTSNAFFFILFISSASPTSSSFLYFLVILTKVSKIFHIIIIFIIRFSCLNLSTYHNNTYFPCCLIYIILARYYFISRYGYVERIGSCIDLAVSSISFNILLIVLLYSEFSLIIFCIWLGHNS